MYEGLRADKIKPTVPLAIKATGVLTSNNTNVSDADTVTIGSQVYTFKTTLTDGATHPGEILIGNSADASLTNLQHTINGTGGTPGTDYDSSTPVNTQVTCGAVTSHAVTVTAIAQGFASNTIATTKSAATLTWGATTLTGGTGGALQAVTANVTGSSLILTTDPIDLSNFQQLMAFLNVTAHAGTNPTLDCKLQYSDDGNSDWVDSGESFTQVTTTNALTYKKFAGNFGKWVRFVLTLGGTNPSYALSFSILASTGNNANATLSGAGDASAANQSTQITAEQAMQATLGATTGAAVSTDANGTIQQYLRGIVKLIVAKIGVTTADGDNATQGVTTGAAVTTDATGTLQQYLRGLVKILSSVATNVAIVMNPLNIGAQAVSSENAAITTGRMAQMVTDLVGKLIVLPYANPENFVSGAITSAMTGTTTTSLLAAPATGLRNYITQITVSNSHATVGTDIIIQDGSGGTTLYTIPAAAVYGGAVITFPVPLRQPTTATAIFCANVTTGSSTKVSASGYKGI